MAEQSDFDGIIIEPHGADERHSENDSNLNVNASRVGGVSVFPPPQLLRFVSQTGEQSTGFASNVADKGDAIPRINYADVGRDEVQCARTRDFTRPREIPGGAGAMETIMATLKQQSEAISSLQKALQTPKSPSPPKRRREESYVPEDGEISDLEDNGTDFLTALDNIFVAPSRVEKGHSAISSVSDDEFDGDWDTMFSRDQVAEPEQDTIEAADEESVINSLQDFMSKSEKSGPAIQQKLADVINSGFKRRVTDTKIKELSDKYSKPQNVDTAMPPRVNSGIWHVLKRNTKMRDAKLQKTHSLILQAFTPMAYLLDSLLTAQESGKGMDKSKVKDAMTLATDTFKLMQVAYTDMVFRRRMLIRPDIKEQYGELCGDNTPVTEFLFGDDLNNQMKEIDMARKMGRQVTKGNFGPRRGQGYSAHTSFSAGRFPGHGGRSWTASRPGGNPGHTNYGGRRPTQSHTGGPFLGRGQAPRGKKR